MIVIIGNGVTSIPANFISGCPNVTSIIIPENVVFIGDGAFCSDVLLCLAAVAGVCGGDLSGGENQPVIFCLILSMNPTAPELPS